MCTVLLPLGVNPIAVNKYIISYHTISNVLLLRSYDRFAQVALVLTRIKVFPISSLGQDTCLTSVFFVYFSVTLCRCLDISSE